MKLEIRPDGSKEGTKILLDGVERTTEHLKRLVWQFDFPYKEWRVLFEYLPRPGLIVDDLPLVSIIDGDCYGDYIEVDLCLNGIGGKE